MERNSVISRIHSRQFSRSLTLKNIGVFFNIIGRWHIFRHETRSKFLPNFSLMPDFQNPSPWSLTTILALLPLFPQTHPSLNIRTINSCPNMISYFKRLCLCPCCILYLECAPLTEGCLLLILEDSSEA